MERSEQLEKFLNDLKKDTPSFEDGDFFDISWCNAGLQKQGVIWTDLVGMR
jgi:hypothetical protein